MIGFDRVERQQCYAIGATTNHRCARWSSWQDASGSLWCGAHARDKVVVRPSFFSWPCRLCGVATLRGQLSSDMCPRCRDRAPEARLQHYLARKLQGSRLELTAAGGAIRIDIALGDPIAVVIEVKASQVHHGIGQLLMYRELLGDQITYALAAPRDRWSDATVGAAKRAGIRAMLCPTPAWLGVHAGQRRGVRASLTAAGRVVA